MSIEEAHILLEQNGEMFTPARYIYIQPSINRKGEQEYEVKIDAGIGDLLNAVFLLWEAVKEESKTFSEQDLYELCEDFDLDYNVFRAQMRGLENEED